MLEAMVMSVGFFLVLAVPVLSGVILLRRGRRLRVAEASCGHCRYPVAATLGTSPRCPECGMLFSEVGVLAPGRRGRGMALLAWTLIVLPLLLCGLAISSSALMARRAAAERAAAVRAQAAAMQAAADAKAKLRGAESRESRAEGNSP